MQQRILYPTIFIALSLCLCFLFVRSFIHPFIIGLFVCLFRKRYATVNATFGHHRSAHAEGAKCSHSTNTYRLQSIYIHKYAYAALYHYSVHFILFSLLLYTYIVLAYLSVCMRTWMLFEFLRSFDFNVMDLYKFQGRLNLLLLLHLPHSIAIFSPSRSLLLLLFLTLYRTHTLLP